MTSANSPAQDIAQLLIDEGICTTNLENVAQPLVRVGHEPDDPRDNRTQQRVLVTLFDSGGPPSNPAWQRDEPRILVRVKAKSANDYPSAWETQQKIKDVLLGMDGREINGTYYVGMWQQVDISNLGPDYNNRSILVSTYRTVRYYDTDNRGCIK